MNKFFVITHKEIPWDIPFDNITIGTEGFIPNTEFGLPASNSISKLLDMETAFGALRALPTINSIINSKLSNTKDVFVSTYRLFLSQETNSDWLSPLKQENKVISPEFFNQNWQTLILHELPPGTDIVIASAKMLPDTILGQYSRVHHLDDLMFATACAIRAGLIDSLSVPTMLNSNILIPYYGLFGSNPAFRIEFNERIWWCAQEFYKNYYVPRFDYQKRVVDFVFERIASMSIIQMIIKRNLNCLSARSIWISETGKYEPTV